ncbi:MAG: alpha/beta fold hydrolase [Bacteroidota bacterium]
MTLYSRYTLLGLCVCFLSFSSCGAQNQQITAATSPCDTTSQKVAIQWHTTNLGQQKVLLAEGEVVSEVQELIVFLHGDAPFEDPTYQYRIARQIASLRSNAVVASLLRPGYKDQCGDRSGGDTGEMIGDNYTWDVIESVNTVVEALQVQYAPSQTTIIGHSGGAALTALLASKYADRMDQALLVSCPCDLPAWRAHMAEFTNNPYWTTPELAGESPVEFVNQLSTQTRIELIVGTEDMITPPDLSQVFLQAGIKYDIKMRLTIIPDGNHDMINQPEILQQIIEMLDLE